MTMKLLNTTNSWCGKVFVTYYVKKMSYIGQIIHIHRHIYTVAHTVIYEKMIMGMIIELGRGRRY